MICEEQLEYELTELGDLLRVSLHFHALAHLGATRGHGAARAFDLHQAHAAGSVGLHAGVMAERRDIDPFGPSHFQDGLPRLGLNLAPVEGQGDLFLPA
jgi:hypothetical protein